MSKKNSHYTLLKAPRKARIQRQRKTIAVDWDGTIWNNSLEEFNPGALDALRQLCNQGTVVLHSCRGNYYEGALWIKGRLAEEGITVDVWTAPGKPIADVYVDDRAIRFTTWEDALNELKNLHFIR